MFTALPMESVVAVLKDTPVPTILVVAGILFLLLAIAGQVAGRITVAPERQRWAAVMGSILLIAGLALYVVPPARLIPPSPPEVTAPTPPTPKEDQPPQPSTAPPSTQLPPPQPEKQDFKVVPLPSLNARVTAVRFFEHSPCSKVPSVEERTYQQRFPQVMTREIYTELTLAHPKQERRLKITIQGFYRHKGHVVNKPEVKTDIPPNQQESVYWFYKHQGEGGVLSCVGGYPRGQSAHIRSMSI
jgi:hypothetical protein